MNEVDKLNITNAKEMSELAVFGEEEFVKSVWEGSFFKGIVRRIEDAALDGYTKMEYRIEKGQLRQIEVMVIQLEKAGYRCRIEQKSGRNLLGKQYFYKILTVDWRKDSSTSMEKYVFTFGCGHPHHSGCHQVVYAEDAKAARLLVVQIYGRNWAFQYSEEEWERVLKDGLFSYSKALDPIYQGQRGEMDEKHVR